MSKEDLDLAKESDQLRREIRLLKEEREVLIMCGRFKDWRRIATRYDRCPKVFLLAVALAAIIIYWL